MPAKPSRKRPVRRRPKQDEPNPIDKHVGRRLYVLRKLKGYSQGRLGDEIGLTFQQVQKYEHGASRISASRLWEISVLFDVPVQYFFDGISEETIRQVQALIGKGPGLAEAPGPAYEADLLAQPGAIGLMRAYSLIDNAVARRHLAGIASALAEVPEEMLASESVADAP